jgi:tetratricopeptide (TPR) repeat protein
VAERTHAPAPDPRRRRPTASTVLAALAATGVLLVLALAPVAAWAATRLPQPLTASGPDLPTVPLAATSGIRAVPVGLPAGTRVRSLADLRAHAVDAVGGPGADRLLALLPPPDGSGSTAVEMTGFEYPFRYGAADEVLSEVPPARLRQGGAALGAALVLLAADPANAGPLADGAARLAFAVLDRARAGGSCDPQLGLLALVSADADVPDDSVDLELRRTEQACPGDPTPGWLAVQRGLHRVSDEPVRTVLGSEDPTRLAAAERVASDLVRRFPDDPGVLATLGDVHLATGEYLAVSQPFTARAAFRDAAAVFDRLERGDAGPFARLGAARAALGLGDAARAGEVAAEVAETTRHPARALQLAVAAQERAHRIDLAWPLARRLAEQGAGAYPGGTALVPLRPPLSFGFDRMTPVTLSLGIPPIPATGEGSVVSDLGFIPVQRDEEGLTDDAPDCPEFVWRRDALLAGEAEAATAGWPQDLLPSDPAGAGVCPDGSLLREQADLAAAGRLPDLDEADPDVAEFERLLDSRQNLLRWAGDLPGARQEVARWAVRLGDETALADQRLGEIDYLSGHFDAAASEFATAAVRHGILDPDDTLAAAESLLGQGAALLRAGRADEAEALLQPLAMGGAQGLGREARGDGDPDTQTAWARVSYYSSTLLGDRALATGHDAGAALHYRTAMLWSDLLTGVVHVDATRNSAAVAALATGDTGGAVALSRAAVDADPASPVYLMTSAVVARRAGSVDSAIAQNRAALQADPTAYPAANNLGVLLARRGDDAEASRVLRAAVAAAPGYALAWHNLGVIEGQRGPLHLLTSQGALARAAALDPGLRDAPREPTLDTALYRTDLDVSKPLPSGWSFAGSQRAAPVATVGLLALALVGAGLVSLRDSSPSSSAGAWLEALGTRLATAPGLRRLRHPGWAVAATTLAFVLAFRTQPVWPWTSLAYAVGLVALVGAGMAARDVLARRHTRGAVHGTWAPGVVVGLVSGVLGSPIAPLPVVRAPVQDSRVALAAPLSLAVLSLALLGEAALLHVPLTTSFCVAAFVMAGSVLLPVRPLDGSRAGAAGVAGVAGLLGGVLLLGLGLA